MKPHACQDADFLMMLRECEGILMKISLFFTNRQYDDFRDLYQEIACTLWEAWPTFRGESNLNTWVMRIALNVAGQSVRKRKRQPQFVELDESVYDTLVEENTDLRYHRLYNLIDRLDDDDERKILFLYLDRKRLREIAQIMGSTENAVKQKLYRIKQKLNKLKTIDDE